MNFLKFVLLVIVCPANENRGDEERGTLAKPGKAA
jgi:hypothetical protein